MIECRMCGKQMDVEDDFEKDFVVDRFFRRWGTPIRLKGEASPEIYLCMDCAEILAEVALGKRKVVEFAHCIKINEGRYQCDKCGAQTDLFVRNHCHYCGAKFI